MNIKTELIKSCIAEMVCGRITDFDIDESKVVDSKATELLGEIQEVLKNGEDDFLIVEDIIAIFIKHNLDFGGCHDF